ncbi:uncharacterized protein SOCE26_037000 [Sorangium cellulosum]|uniref:Uncharacterized protein n=1 Tax=Sorangium cellulosum TaxID=56 RepID=A0A2L0ESM7_SORCE|nr:uncharacterized protein SOCE26_037000 [Sorangium cellulosum]
MKLVARITEPTSIARFLAALGEPSTFRAAPLPRAHGSGATITTARGLARSTFRTAGVAPPKGTRMS